ncbi:MAG: SWIM zinc finger family protein [Marmoricola sp.]
MSDRKWSLVDLLLEYARPSQLDLAARRLTLETVSPPTAREARTLARPRFFDGFLTRPGVAALALRQVAQVAATSYFDRDRPLGVGADPLVTSDGSRLRFEAFSLCGGVLARLDVLPSGLDGAFLERGTTNVDVNEPLRRLLTRVAGDDFLHLNVGSDGLVATSPNEQAVERKVALSDHWLRGFAEAQASAATLEPCADLSGAEALRFLQQLPRRAEGWIIQSGTGLRLTSRPVPGGFWLSRADRLESLLPMLPQATSVRVYGPRASGEFESASSIWQVDLRDARFLVHLSAAPARGFSGEGSVLLDLIESEAVADAEVIAGELDHQARLDPVQVGGQLDLSRERVVAGLAALAVAGRVGYDVAEAGYFHRDLPFDALSVARLHPRLRNAEGLVASGGVTLVSEDQADVVGTDTVHRVRSASDAESCTCRWWTTHRGARGPCQHVLAVRLARAEAR